MLILQTTRGQQVGRAGVVLNPVLIDSSYDGREESEANIGDLFPMDLEEVTEPTSLAGHFGTAQLEDPNLANALGQVKVVDGKPLERANKAKANNALPTIGGTGTS